MPIISPMSSSQYYSLENQSLYTDVVLSYIKCEEDSGFLLCGRRPHYASCLSVRPSVCQSVCPEQAHNSKTNVEKSKLV